MYRYDLLIIDINHPKLAKILNKHINKKYTINIGRYSNEFRNQNNLNGDPYCFIIKLQDGREMTLSFWWIDQRHERLNEIINFFLTQNFGTNY